MLVIMYTDGLICRFLHLPTIALPCCHDSGQARQTDIAEVMTLRITLVLMHVKAGNNVCCGAEPKGENWLRLWSML